MNSSPSLASFESPLSGRSCIQSSKQNIVYHTCLASPPFRTAYHGGVRIRRLSVFHFNYFLVVKSILYFFIFIFIIVLYNNRHGPTICQTFKNTANEKKYCQNYQGLLIADTAQLFVRYFKTQQCPQVGQIYLTMVRYLTFLPKWSDFCQKVRFNEFRPFLTLRKPDGTKNISGSLSIEQGSKR